MSLPSQTMRDLGIQVKSLVSATPKSDLCSLEIIQQDGIQAAVGGRWGLGVNLSK